MKTVPHGIAGFYAHWLFLSVAYLDQYLLYIIVRVSLKQQLLKGWNLNVTPFEFHNFCGRQLIGILCASFALDDSFMFMFRIIPRVEAKAIEPSRFMNKLLVFTIMA